MWKLWPPPFEISRYATTLDVTLIAIEEVRNYRKFYTLKIFLKMEGGRVHISHPSPTPLDPLLSPDPYATETIKRVWHILVTWHH